MIARMKIFLLAAGLLTLLNGNAQQKDDWANFSKYSEANKSVRPGSVVFMGNSITEGWAGKRSEFFSAHQYTGRGISGQTSSQMLVRFRRDVIDLQPRAVVILAGTNDIAQNTGYISLENILGNIKSMTDLAQAHKIRVILCSVLPAYRFGWRPSLEPAQDIIRLNEMIRTFAQSRKIPYVDYHSALKDERNGLPEKYAKDGVHPTDEGYALMEQLVQPVIAKTLKKRKP
ncbi:SGNH/GDSL hydrolase family protein [Niabella terrae]